MVTDHVTEKNFYIRSIGTKSMTNNQMTMQMPDWREN